MIRIDEIYNHTFWPWFEQNRPGTRMFFCDPFGHTDPEHLFNFGAGDIVETDYVFMHDQEPVHIDQFRPLFEDVIRRNADINWPNPPRGHVVVSERGEYVDNLVQRYGWKPHYYFFHGWACLDWFRGYDKTFIIPRARQRTPTKTFVSPNRIVGGMRDHRVLFLYNVFKNQLAHNYISAPRICQYEGVDISIIADKYCNIYPDIKQVFDQAQLPRLFKGEAHQQMTSCWLSNFSEAQDSLVYVPTETVYFGRRLHLTEKTFKAIALEMPFVMVAPAGSLEYLREYGFQTFASVLDESYDLEIDDLKRVERVVKLLADLSALTVQERQQLHRHMLPMVEHNYNHFYQGGFANVLWKELNSMLKGLNV
jgi:hypothetical protein